MAAGRPHRARARHPRPGHRQPGNRFSRGAVSAGRRAVRRARRRGRKLLTHHERAVSHERPVSDRAASTTMNDADALAGTGVARAGRLAGAAAGRHVLPARSDRLPGRNARRRSRSGRSSDVEGPSAAAGWSSRRGAARCWFRWRGNLHERSIAAAKADRHRRRRRGCSNVKRREDRIGVRAGCMTFRHRHDLSGDDRAAAGGRGSSAARSSAGRST